MMVVLEGLPGAGKTTLIERLVNEHGYAAVPEMMLEYTDPDTGFISFEFERRFLQNDELKCARAKDLLELYPAVVMDKNYISTLAFNYAVTACRKGDAYDEVVGWYRRNEAVLVKPDLYFFLSLPIGLSFSRKGRTEDATSFWNSKDVLNSMNEFYKSKFSQFDPAIPMYTLNAEKPQDQVLNEILSITSSMRYDRR